MRKLALFILCFAVVLTATAQQSVNFQKISIEEALLLAKKENKLLFIDLSMTGCAPCKYMMDSVFTKKSVSDFYNKNFISVHYNTTEDTAAAKFAKENDVQGFPTFLFLNPVDGKLVHSMMGGRDDESTIEMGEMALNPKRGSVYITEQYMSGNRDFNLMTDCYYLALIQYEKVKMRLIINEMGKIWGTNFKNDQLNDFFFEAVNFKDNDLAQYFLQNAKSMSKKFGKEKVYNKIPTLK